MRATPPLLVLGALLAVTGCYGGGDGSGGLPADIPTGGTSREYTYQPGEQITVDLTMHADGRTTPFLSGYQPTIEFAYQEQTAECSARLPVDLHEFPPGGNHVIGLDCDQEITVHTDTPGFRLLEDGTEYGTGEVVFTDARP